MFKTNLDFANLCLYNELDEISCCFIFCDVWEHKKIKNTIVRNSFSAVDSRKKHFEPPHDKTNKITFVPSKDSDQPGHLPSLIGVFAVRSVGSLGLNFADSDQTGRMPRLI